MISINDIQAVRAASAHSQDGHKVGRVGDVYVDDLTNQPAWVTITAGLFGTKTLFAPLEGARLDGEHLVLAYDKDTIGNAPAIADSGHISDTEQQALIDYFTTHRAGGPAAQPAADAAPAAAALDHDRLRADLDVASAQLSGANPPVEAVGLAVPVADYAAAPAAGDAPAGAIIDGAGDQIAPVAPLEHWAVDPNAAPMVSPYGGISEEAELGIKEDRWGFPGTGTGADAIVDATTVDAAAVTEDEAQQEAQQAADNAWLVTPTTDVAPEAAPVEAPSWQSPASEPAVVVDAIPGSVDYGQPETSDDTEAAASEDVLIEPAAPILDDSGDEVDAAVQTDQWASDPGAVPMVSPYGGRSEPALAGDVQQTWGSFGLDEAAGEGVTAADVAGMAAVAGVAGGAVIMDATAMEEDVLAQDVSVADEDAAPEGTVFAHALTDEVAAEDAGIVEADAEDAVTDEAAAEDAGIVEADADALSEGWASGEFVTQAEAAAEAEADSAVEADAHAPLSGVAAAPADGDTAAQDAHSGQFRMHPGHTRETIYRDADGNILYSVVHSFDEVFNG